MKERTKPKSFMVCIIFLFALYAITVESGGLFGKCQDKLQMFRPLYVIFHFNFQRYMHKPFLVRRYVKTTFSIIHSILIES